MLRPPPPDLHGALPAGRLELRKTDKNGLSVGGEAHFAPDLHDWGGRDVLVVRGVGGPLPVLARDGHLTHALTEDALNETFRDAFYANRRAQRDRIEERALRKFERDGGTVADGTQTAQDQTRPRTVSAATPPPLDSPLDALRPLADLGWPFDDLRQTTPRPARKSHATPLR